MAREHREERRQQVEVFDRPAVGAGGSRHVGEVHHVGSVGELASRKGRRIRESRDGGALTCGASAAALHIGENEAAIVSRKRSVDRWPWVEGTCSIPG